MAIVDRGRSLRSALAVGALVAAAALAGCATPGAEDLAAARRFADREASDIHISAVGRYEDELVRRGGKWFIVKRVRSE